MPHGAVSARADQDPHKNPTTVLIEAHDEWQVGERRYLSEESMALLAKPAATPEEVATPALLTA
jgi:hypothetical protein